MHYQRWKKKGTPGSAAVINQRGRICSVLECGLRTHAHGFCQKHHWRWKHNGDPHVINKNVYDVLTYGGVHDRNMAVRGSATNYYCQRCGCQAAEWAYDGKDPDELVGFLGSSNISLKYSLKIEHYLALCKLCHAAYDAKPRLSCTEDGCNRKRSGRGLCSMHYQRYRKAKLRGE